MGCGPFVFSTVDVREVPLGVLACLREDDNREAHQFVRRGGGSVATYDRSPVRTGSLDRGCQQRTVSRVNWSAHAGMGSDHTKEFVRFFYWCPCHVVHGHAATHSAAPEANGSVQPRIGVGAWHSTVRHGRKHVARDGSDAHRYPTAT